ncbi:hypothetical protein T08_11864 [Trichinella sp. T8]|nr:hypothetical protein T08_11864 [Trichinella sp. T8]
MKCNSSFLKRFSFIKLLLENLGRMKHKMAFLLQLLLCLIKCNLNLQLQAAMAHHKQDGVENKSGSTEKSQNRFQNDGILFLAHKIGNYLLIQSENGYVYIKNIQEMKVQNGKHYFENTKSKLTKIAREKEFASYLIRLRRKEIKHHLLMRESSNEIAGNKL